MYGIELVATNPEVIYSEVIFCALGQYTQDIRVPAGGQAGTY
jgi:hypothetical protein